MSDSQGSGVSGLHDVKQLGLVAAIASLGYVFWVVGAMEMVERLAYYGVKAVAALYATDPASKGGLGISMGEFSIIMMIWAAVQSFLPVFTGSLSDRYGYKETIFVSTIVKICGYIFMAFYPTFLGFLGGAMLLATGTAIFKPGIQGTLVKATNRTNSSMAWGIFYQTVNIGGFLGPLVAGAMRKMAWSNVFYACAAIICANFILLLTYREPGKEERLERARLIKLGSLKQSNLVVDSLHELSKRHVWTYLLVFSGFWFMFNSLFDVLPVHIQEWVDTRDIITTLFGAGGAQNWFVQHVVITTPDGTAIQPEGMLNLNAGLIMITCFAFAALSAKMRATTSMVIGTLLATLALLLSGWSAAGWISVGAILLFSVGEMLSSPKFSEYIGNFAPSDKKAMYLGFSQIPLAIGWTLEGLIGPRLYGVLASKELFSREVLTQVGAAPALAQSVPEGEVFQRLTELTAQDPYALTAKLLETHNPGVVWYIMAIIGVLSAIGIALYGRWVLTLKKT